MDHVIFDTGVYVIEQMYHVIDQALNYMIDRANVSITTIIGLS